VAKVLKKLKREIARGLSRFGLQTVRTNYNGLPLTVPMLRGVGRKLIVPDDPWMSRCLRRQLELKPGAVLDIGANAGIYLVKLRSLDRQRRYIGFEPNPLCKYFISEVIRLNSFVNASCFPLALSDQNAVKLLYARTQDDAGASLIQEYKQHQAMPYTAEVVTEVGDEFLQRLEFPDGIAVVKVDVEGAELEVLRGLRATIERYRPSFYCEIWPPAGGGDETDRKRIERIEAVLALLKDYRYRVLGAREPGELFQVHDVDSMKQACRPEFLLVHQDDLDAFLRIFSAERGIPVDTPI
jgi:FkbM family methyltransferase